MPPQKGFSGQENYLDRNVHDDLLELLPESTIETVQVKNLTSLNLDCLIRVIESGMLIPHKLL